MSARVMAQPMGSRPRIPCPERALRRTVGGPADACQVQSRPEPVTAAVMPRSSASALGNVTLAISGSKPCLVCRSVIAGRGRSGSPGRRSGHAGLLHGGDDGAGAIGDRRALRTALEGGPERADHGVAAGDHIVHDSGVGELPRPDRQFGVVDRQLGRRADESGDLVPVGQEPLDHQTADPAAAHRRPLRAPQLPSDRDGELALVRAPKSASACGVAASGYVRLIGTCRPPLATSAASRSSVAVCGLAITATAAGC